ncbi:MAG: tRNA (N6-threonylcarbamoyladenosine(37)-N6)-methyltransferase TrmO [Methanomicrobiaceae archaeon]|nr:tRNA (N6-threonylcarbamoyladenosine(37)-N6)-methyltransferase TrmO [Methanomicrobiaceae archaeon]
MTTNNVRNIPVDLSGYGEITIRPVAVVRNNVEKPFLVAGKNGLEMQGGNDENISDIRSRRDEISEIIVDEKYCELLEGVEDYSHLIVLFWGHEVTEEGRSLKRIHPMGRKDYPEMGIFSTCSPARPNPVLMTAVKLHSRKGNVLEVSGFDAIDGSPVIDIKPFVINSLPKENIRTAWWMEELHKEIEEKKNN